MIEQTDSFAAEVQALFAANNWGFSELYGPPALLCELSGPFGNWPLCVQIVPETELLIFYAMAPVVVPEAQRPAMAEFIARANYGLTLGTLELDFADGEVRSKVVLARGGKPLQAAVVERMIRVSGRLMETFLASITAVAEGAEPSAVAARLETAGSR